MQKALLGTAILAMCNAQFDDGDFEAGEPLEFEKIEVEQPKPSRPSNVSELTDAIADQNNICKKEFQQYMNGLDWQQKMKIAMNAMTLIKDVQIVGAESVYTADEAAHRMRHCDDTQDERQKELCKKMSSKLIKTGEINYMTFKGKRAFNNMCKVQEHLPSCQKSCDLTHQFFSAPAEEDCSKLQDSWQEECVKVARGELVFRNPTAAEKQMLRANGMAIRECRREHAEYQTQCANQLQSHLDRILSKKGDVKKSVTQKIGKCFYKSVRNFTQCVKKAPDVPEGMEFQDAEPKRKNGLSDILGGLMKQMQKKNRSRGGGRGSRGGRGGNSSWRDNRRRGRGRGRGRTQPVVVEPVEEIQEDEINFDEGDDQN